MFLGRVYLLAGRFQEAEETLMKAKGARRRAPDDEALLDDLIEAARSLAAWSRGDIEAARACAREVHDPRLRAYLTAQFGPPPASAAGRSR